MTIGALCLLAGGCNHLDDERIPAMAVSVDLSNQGIWNTFGVHGYGQYNYFIFRTDMRLPAGFPYTYNSATGYGGVLLIRGQSFGGDVVPLAYDLSCPVERLPDVRVFIDNNSLEAVCPDCHSRYDVTEAGGAPTDGPAKAMHYGLTPYTCYPTNMGGYFITR